MQDRTASETEIMIVGAGLAGLMAAYTLATHGRRVFVVDKAARVGGRLATRMIGAGLADHGAQFFTVRDPAFRRWVQAWEAAGLVYTWSTGWSDGSLATTQPDGFPRYAVRGGMQQLAQAVADQANIAGARIMLNTPIAQIAPTARGWEVVTATGDLYHTTTLVNTPPVPQALALLATGATPLGEQDRRTLERITYAPCLCGLFAVDGVVHLPAPGALQRPGAEISWIADNQRKGISPAATLITVHASPDFSERCAALSDEEVLATLQSALAPYLAPAATVYSAQLKRWRYAAPLLIHPERYLLAANLPPLYFGGDAFGGPRVEGAALSGLAIGTALTL